MEELKEVVNEGKLVVEEGRKFMKGMEMFERKEDCGMYER